MLSNRKHKHINIKIIDLYAYKKHTSRLIRGKLLYSIDKN